MKFFLTALWALMLAATSVSAQSNYQIKPGDTVAIEVLEDAALNRSLLVLPDGTIDFPFAGSITAAGRTAGEVQSTIASQIAGNFASPPTVFVSVTSVAPDVVRSTGSVAAATIDIYFTGEVNAPGLKPMAPGTTFLQAIAQSGGFTKFAATKRVQLRRSGQGVYTINYKALGNGAALENDIILRDGDVILVPERRLFE